MKSEAELAFRGCPKDMPKSWRSFCRLQPRWHNRWMAVEVDDCLREHQEEPRMKEAVSEPVTSRYPDPIQWMGGNSPRH